MSATPRHSALWAEIEDYSKPWDKIEALDEFAEDLECELVTMTAERDAWKKAALHCGENYWGGVGPDGYYSFTAQQFMAWLKGE